jgi:hypothetical protein
VFGDFRRAVRDFSDRDFRCLHSRNTTEFYLFVYSLKLKNFYYKRLSIKLLTKMILSPNILHFNFITFPSKNYSLRISSGLFQTYFKERNCTYDRTVKVVNPTLNEKRSPNVRLGIWEKISFCSIST